MKKNNLIVALEKEMKSLINNGVDVYDHEITIEFLKTGKISPNNLSNIENYDLLDTALNDLEDLYYTYVTSTYKDALSNLIYEIKILDLDKETLTGVNHRIEILNNLINNI